MAQMLGMLQGLQGGGGGGASAGGMSPGNIPTVGGSNFDSYGPQGGDKGGGNDFLKRFMAGAMGSQGGGSDFASRFRQGAMGGMGGMGGGMGNIMQMLPMIMKLLQFNGGGQ